MSYEGQHWGCGHDRKECDGDCNRQETRCWDCNKVKCQCDELVQKGTDNLTQER